MDSKPYARLSATQGTPGKLALLSSSSLAGSLPIRAPPTPDSDSDSDSEFNGHDLGYSSSCNISSIGCESGSESEAFVTGEEFETVSERPLVADPEEEALEQSDSVEKYELSWPSVAYPDEFEPVFEKVMVDDAISQRVMPIAQLSWESDDNDVVGSEEVLSEVENGDFLGQVKVPGNGFVEKLSIAPRVKVSEVKEGEEDETVTWEEPLVVEQSEPAIEVKNVEGVERDLNNFGKGQNGDSVQAEWIEDNGLAMTETNEANAGELSINVFEEEEKAKYVAEESFVHCPNSERNGVDLGVEWSENQTLFLENCDLSELTKDEEFENALCIDLLKSITLNSLSVTLLCKNVAENAGAVKFQGDTVYGAKVEVSLKEKDIPAEKEQTSLVLLGENISITPGVMVVEEGEEYGPVLRKESLVIKQSEPSIELNCVECSDFKGQNGDSIQAEMIEDNDLAAAEINDNFNVWEGGEKAEYVAEESFVHCPNNKRDGVDTSRSFEALEKGMHSGTDFGVEKNENQIQEIMYLGNGDLSEATDLDRFEYALCCDFLKLITPSSNVTHKHIFRGQTEVRNFNIDGTAASLTVTLSDENVVTGLKIEDQMTIGKHLVLAGSAGALQFEGETAHGAKLEVRLKNKDCPKRQDQTGLGLSLMKWGGGLVLTADILSLFSVGGSKMAVHVVLNNKQRGQIAIRTSNSDKFQSALVVCTSCPHGSGSSPKLVSTVIYCGQENCVLSLLTNLSDIVCCSLGLQVSWSLGLQVSICVSSFPLFLFCLDGNVMCVTFLIKMNNLSLYKYQRLLRSHSLTKTVSVQLIQSQLPTHQKSSPSPNGEALPMNFKSFATHSFSFKPREATMAVIQTSPYRVLSQRTCSSFRSTASVGLFYFRDRSSVKVFSLFHMAHHSSYSNDEFASSSKRRSRGPVMAAKKAAEGAKQEDGKYKHTVDLPKTSFGMRANSLIREPEIQKIWDDNQVFKRVVGKNTGENFILHDGPPYANGDLHIGHALNKILKDFINRYKLLQNYKVHYVPGWDCHGLPIELKGKYFLQSLDQAARKDLTPIKLRQKAAKFAKQTVKTQMESFKRYGVWADWNNPYLTLDPEYEAAQIEVFGQMVIQGFIYRGRKPVHWSPSSRTALAEAELEYPEGHVSRSIYAIFKLVSASPTSGGLLNEYFPNVCLAIWTTTPWTIPANAAVAVNAKLIYAIVEVQSDPEDVSLSDGNKKRRPGNVLKEENKPFLIVASDLVPALEAKWGVKLVVRKRVSGSDLENCRYVHPVFNRECPVVIGGDYITTESGTGLVHTAPGHGQEDYVTGLKYGLPMLSPVDDEGKFTEEAGKFCGLDVLADGNSAVVKYLDEHLSIIMEESYQHKYPYDWRTKKPTIFRATEQWFASVEGFREAVMDAIGHVKWIPPKAENRISAMTSSRSDWCISRQRTWGVPIPVFYHVQSKEPLMNEETMEHIKSIISEKGSDAWWYMKVEDLLPDKYRDKASEYEKGTDTMDVWFDSGSSWAAVLGKRNSHSLPADLYLEGMDQHRGWFQSSLLTSVATKGKAPYSSVITHGFVLDEKGSKMSKSLGNVVDPRTVIEGGKNQKDGYGADVLRLWVSSVDYTGDVTIGPQILRQMSDIYRKLRGTLRYLLGNLHDWHADTTISYHDLPMIDQHALFQLENFVKNSRECYENYQFFKIFQIIQRFVIVDLSNFYFDVAKDRLYVGGTTSFTRRSCQTVLAELLLSIVRVIAPILPHLAEDVWQNLPFQYTDEDGSAAEFVFESRWPALNKTRLSLPKEETDFWEKVLELRTEVNRVLEVARTEKLIGSSLDAKVYLHTSDSSLASRLVEMSAANNDADTLHRIFITSQAEVLPSLENKLIEDIPYKGEYVIEGNIRVWIGVSRAEGLKCERCWNYSPQVGSFPEHSTLCRRCYNVVDIQQSPAVAVVS
ncbi:hypothetical protein GBA52_004416 [Prunus armeniaca]|nr:hypothetical protein GBA52_004416 [Prunus armeniaca]